MNKDELTKKDLFKVTLIGGLMIGAAIAVSDTDINTTKCVLAVLMLLFALGIVFSFRKELENR